MNFKIGIVSFADRSDALQMKMESLIAENIKATLKALRRNISMQRDFCMMEN
jgi:hypothetical protein